MNVDVGDESSDYVEWEVKVVECDCGPCGRFLKLGQVEETGVRYVLIPTRHLLAQPILLPCLHSNHLLRLLSNISTSKLHFTTNRLTS